MGTDDLRRRLLERSDRERAQRHSQALVETFPGTSQGRALPSSPLDQRPGKGVPAVNVVRNPGAGEHIALHGSVTIAGAGSGVATQLDTIQSQVAVTSVSAAGDGITLRKALWLIETDIRWTDGYRGGGTVEVTLGGTAIANTWDDSGPWGRFVDTMTFPVSAQSTFDVKVTPDDGQEHDAEVTLRVTLVEKLRTVAETIVSSPSTARTWASGSHNGDSSGTLDDTLDPGSDIEEGDLLVATVFGATYNAQAPTLDDIPGWTTLAKDGVNSGAFTGAGHCWLIAVKVADADDVADTATYSLVMNRPGTKSINDFIHWRTSAVPLGGGTVDTANATTDSGDTGPGTSSTYTAAALSTGDYGLVVALSGCSSTSGSRNSQVTIDSPASELSSSTPDKMEGAVGDVATGDAAQITAATSDQGDFGRIVGAVCVLPVTGGTGG